MKTKFQFYFHLIIVSAFVFATLYGVAERFVQQHAASVSFAVMAIILISLGGMAKSLMTVSPEK